jgi:hypothetical protein
MMKKSWMLQLVSSVLAPLPVRGDGEVVNEECRMQRALRMWRVACDE